MADEFKVKNGLKFPDNTIQITAAASSNWLKKTANYTASNGEKIMCDTTGGTFTLTLPASPSTGHSVSIADGNSWKTTNLTVARNGNTIEGSASDLTVDIAAIEITFIYDGTTWEVFAHTGPDALPSQSGASGKFLSTNGTIASWADISVITDDVATNASRYLLFDDVTSGNAMTVGTSSTKLYFNPNTGTMNCTSFNSLSDRRLKDNIQPLTVGLKGIENINPVSYTWKDNGRVSWGVIAQELEEFYPHMISKHTETGIKSVDYTQMIPMLIQAVKELSAEVEELKGKLV